MAFWDKQIKIGEFRKNKVETIVISKCIVDSKHFIDIRTHRHFKDGVYKATSKGVVMPLSKLEDMLELLGKIRGEWYGFNRSL